MSDQELWFNRPLGYFVRDIGDGGTPSRADERNFGGPIPWVVITDIQRKIHHTKENLSKKGLASCTSKLWPKNSIILSTGATIGKVGIAKVPLATKQGITGIVAIDYVIPEYLYYELLYKKNNIVAWAQGSTFAEIRVPILTKVPLKVPKNRKIQKKIVIILETIDQSIEKTEALIYKYQQIKAGLMHDLFTRGVTADGKLRPPREQARELYKETPIGWIPKEWEVTQFGNCIDVLTDYHANGAYEILKKHVELLDHPDFALMIRTTNFERDDFDIEIKYISKSAYYFLDKSIVQPKDILMNKIANPGTVYLMPDLGIPVSLGMNLFLIRVKKKYSPVFIYSFLRKHEDYVKSFSSGTGTKTITKDSVRALIIGLPTPTEQEKIGAAIFSVEQKIRKEKKLLAKLNKQKSGLMHDLLTGKVPVKIDQEETAHV